MGHAESLKTYREERNVVIAYVVISYLLQLCHYADAQMNQCLFLLHPGILRQTETTCELASVPWSLSEAMLVLKHGQTGKFRPCKHGTVFMRWQCDI